MTDILWPQFGNLKSPAIGWGTAAVLPLAPVNTAVPAITGTAQEGQTLTASTGGWDNGPDSYAYQWRRGGVAISGATASTYTAGAADVGSTLAVTVTAGNAGGSASATSAATGPVGAASGGTPPSIVTAAGVAVTATAYEAETYTFTPPVVAGSPAPTVTRVLTLDGVDVTGAMSGNVYVASKSETVRKALVMTYTASNGTAPAATSTVTASVPKAMHVVVWLGQSNIEYALNNGGPYTNAGLLANIPITTVNATYIGPDNSDNSGIVRAIPVTQANVTARRINTSIAQASQWLAYVAPGKQFVFVDGAQSGTSRWQLSDDTDTERLWEDFTAVISLAETIGPINQVIEWWYANDAGDLASFTEKFAPFYLRQYDNGTVFPLGTTFNTRRWDHVLWDANAASLDDKGLGVFNRRTKWTYVENHHKDSSQANSDGIAAFWADSRVQAFAAPKGVWAGLYANDDAHALTAEADGQVFLQWPITTSVARAVGVTIHEPTFVSGPSGIVMSPDGLGTWAEILVDLPNGGTLTTVRIKEGRGAVPSLQLPFQQPLTGMEIMRDGAGLPKLPVYRAAETVDENGATIDNRAKGLVEISDTGSGSPRRGRIRITPTVPFANNDRIYPLHLKDQTPYPQTFVPDYVSTEDPPDLVYQAKVRAAATKSWLDFPVERVTALEDPAATYKYPGVPVRPWSAPYIVSGVTEAPFTFEPRSVVTSASSHLRDNPYTPTVFAGNEGMLSIWFKCTEASWPSPVTLMQMRNGGTIIFALTTASSGRVTSPLSLTDGNTILPTAVTNDFAVGGWNNLLLSWKLGPGGWTQVVRNGGAVRSGSVPAATPRLRMTDLGITAISIGAQTTGNTPWPGEIGHVYINLNQALDLNTPANVAKFYSAGAPVSLGRYGQLPTGANPAFYFDGPPTAWNNQGTALDLTAIGTFTAGSVPGP